MENGRIMSVQVIDNPGVLYEHGSGPIAAITLVDLKVNFVLVAGYGSKRLRNT